jgi:hypothetical protein
MTPTAAEAVAAGTPSPRIGLVIGLWQCDKENHGWREGLPLTVAAKFRSEDRPSPSGKVSLERKKNTVFRCRSRASLRTLAGYKRHFGEVSSPSIRRSGRFGTANRRQFRSTSRRVAT